jgi:riboflavin kinase/FMN adenylyltransferase
MRGPSFTLLEAETPHAGIGVRPSVVAVGNFDGVHRGHQAVIAEAVRDGGGRGLAVYVLTFDPHPAEVLGRGAPPMLTVLARRAELLVRAGAEEVFVRRFDAAFAAWEPERFARELLVERLGAKIVVVGQNFRFGAGAEGDLALLVSLGAKHGFEARVETMSGDAKGSFSSTRVRGAIAAGDMADATHVLGRPHAISGVVGQGAQRGRTIGFPTANLEQIPEMLPADGVYAILVDELDASSEARFLARGVMNIGVRPTLNGPPTRTVEAHLFDFARDLYGARLRVHVIARIRAERKFAGLDELKAQIAKDAAEARRITEPIADEAGPSGG